MYSPASSIKKLTGRFKTIALNSIAQLIFPASGIILSWAVFNFCSDGLWGQFTGILLILNFAPHIMGWGNKDYLLRSFSTNPAEAPIAWMESLSTRFLFIILLALFLAFYPASLTIKGIIFIWCIARFIYQSYDVVILYKRKFFNTFLLESFALLITLSYIITFRKQIDIDKLSLVFMIAELIKTLIIIPIFYKDFPVFKNIHININYLKSTFPFFIIVFSGLVQSRTDLLCVNYLMPAAQVGHFQVLTTFLLYTEAVSGFILSPYVKNIYRLGSNQIKKISFGLFGAGVGIITFSLVCIYFIMNVFYHFNPGFPVLVMGGLSILPIFFYLPIIYELFKYNRQNDVLFANIFGIVLGFILNVIFIRNFEDGIMGSLTATAITQWLFIPIYLNRIVSQRRPSESGQARAQRFEN